MDSWSIDVKIVLWDDITFPEGTLGLRNNFSEYAAANDLQYKHNWWGNSRLYAVWDDHFDSNHRP
jgi:hypothetical protein